MSTVVPDELRSLRPGDYRKPCLRCAETKHRPRDSALSVTVIVERGVWCCHRCGWTGSWRAEGAAARAGWRGKSDAGVRSGWSNGALPDHSTAGRTSATTLHTTLSPEFRAIWTAAQPVDGGAATYLRGRQCVIPPADGDLRWHPDLRAWGGLRHRGPALVGLVTDVLTREPISLHATFLAPDGNGKAALDRTKLYAPRHRKAGGVVRLWPDEAVTTGIAVAEGIESALSAAHAFTPVWACLDAGNVAALPVVDGIESITVLADHDEAGIRAARSCAERWAAAGREARIALPPVEGADLNDDLVRTEVAA